MDADQIERQLLNEIRARRGQDLFTANSLLNLLAMVHEGANRMVAEGRDSEQDLREAKANLRRFLDVMEEGRLKLKYPEYREKVVTWARKKVCPLWPICKSA
jgi:hypothetical protein